jgi:hypothetical protein
LNINYTTNFTVLRHRNYKVLDYWKKFSNVTVSASLDDSGKRAEYLRKGTKWEVVEQNRIDMMRECPNVKFELTPTISVYNALHFPEFHMDWIERGLVEPNQVRLNILTEQKFMSVKIMPRDIKEKVVEKYLDYIERIEKFSRERNLPCDRAVEGYKGVISFINKADDIQLTPQFINRSSVIDAIRSEDIREIYPELDFIWRKLER